MPKCTITSVGNDANGRSYDLDDDSPYDAITVNEGDGTITLHGTPPVENALNHLVGMERDRLLGYPERELHMNPADALRMALAALTERGRDSDFFVQPTDQQKLAIDFSQFGEDD